MSGFAPASEEELADTVRAAAAARRPLAIEGGGTRGLGHPVDGERLATAGLAGITLYEPGALTLVVRAGTPLAEVEAALAAEGQRLPFEPWDARALTGANGVPTIGGAVAVNASGPRRIKAGACRDSLIGVRFVDGTGTVIRNGGRVMKNVTGLDLVKLMAGSHGTLGVLTELAFKVLPQAETAATLVLEGLDDVTAGRAMTTALGHAVRGDRRRAPAARAGRSRDLAAPRRLRRLGRAPGGGAGAGAGRLRHGARRGGAGRLGRPARCRRVRRPRGRGLAGLGQADGRAGAGRGACRR